MSKASFVSEDLYSYILSHSVAETDLLSRLREETSRTEMPQMQISADQGRFLSLLVQLIGAVNTIEIGVFTGYSTLCVAQALPLNGRIVACDVSEEWTSIAIRYWNEAGIAHKVDLRLAPALTTLRLLQKEGRDNFFDFAFIDADKKNLDSYFEHALALVRPRGLIAVDNVLWSGRVIDPAEQDEDTVAIRALNDKLVNDQRVEVCMLSIADGLTLAMKKE